MRSICRSATSDRWFCKQSSLVRGEMSFIKISAAISLSVMFVSRLFKKFALLSIAETPLLSGGVFYAAGVMA